MKWKFLRGLTREIRENKTTYSNNMLEVQYFFALQNCHTWAIPRQL